MPPQLLKQRLLLGRSRSLAYHLLSMCWHGIQNTLTFLNTSHSFGSSLRQDLVSSDAPGPGPGSYSIPSTLFQSRGFSLRGRVKFGSAALKAIDPISHNEPGPGHYLRPGGRAGEKLIVNPKEKHAPEYSFPKSGSRGVDIRNGGSRGSRRPTAAHPRAAAGPPPRPSSTIGEKQVISTKPSPPSALFGKSKSARYSKPYTDIIEVGPGEYDGARIAACGAKQVDSRRRNQTGISFGKAEKTALRQTTSIFDEVVIAMGKKKDHTLGVCGKAVGAATAANNSKKKGISLSGREKYGSIL